MLRFLIVRISLVLFLILNLSSCSKKDSYLEEIAEPSESYSKGLEFLKKNDYENATKEFKKIYFQHPGSIITPYSELMQAYSLFQSRKYEESYDVLDNFIIMHPAHPDISYAYYLKALSSYMQISDAKKDQSNTKESLNDFNSLINRFPNTKYAVDAKLKIDLLNNYLAAHDMEVGIYYLNKKIYAGAINRFQEIVKNHDTTIFTPEALFRLVESYKMLNQEEEAIKYASVLKHNYPDNMWTKHALALFSQENDNKK